MSLISVSGLTYTYAGSETPALREIELEIEPGEFVVLAGMSGSGKSTLLRAISGLVPHFYGGSFAGTVTVADHDTRSQGPGQLAAVVGSLFQDPETQIVLGTPRAELAFAVENRGWSPAEVARAVEETALALAVDSLLDRPVAELSGGELQRVALGATLSARPAVVCLDEPTSQLDPVAGDELIGLLRRLNEDGDTAVILAEHRLERCLGVADRVLAMDRGRLVFDGAPDRFLEWALVAAPSLVTPGAKLLSGLGLKPVPGVKRARSSLRAADLTPDAVDICDRIGTKRQPHRDSGAPALRFKGVWHEIKDGPAILQGLDLTVAAGERVALMGRNGAGKSTLLRHAAGLMRPTRGKVEAAGRVALLLQNPTDYLVHDTVGEEVAGSEAALSRFALTNLAARHPRDLSGGEKQRLALAIVLGDPAAEPAAVLCLDEPTRGMDRAVKDDLAGFLKMFSGAVVVATHDPEFAAAFADRVVLVADGAVIADGPAAEVLSGGTYFATETARILGGAGGVLLPTDGVALLRRGGVEVPA
jgi:energy-coupling factor transport system ATP-binding protein